MGIPLAIISPMTDATCPVCARPMVESRALNVCEGCHDNLRLASTAVVTTGEFALSDIAELAERAQMQPTTNPTTNPTTPSVPAPVSSPATARMRVGKATCTWCGRDEDQVRKLLGSGIAHICNACVALCADILSAEFGPDWGD